MSPDPQSRARAVAHARDPVMLVRVDAGESLGFGHAMRCLALAQAWRDRGGDAVFVMAETAPEMESRIRAEGCELTRVTVVTGTTEDATVTARRAAETRASWVVLDGYGFGARYLRDIRAAGNRVLVIDDAGRVGAWDADLIVDQNLGVTEEVYRGRDPDSRLLLGPRFVMLRREFLEWQEWRRSIPPVARTVLITFGGGEAADLTLQAVRALAGTDDGPREATVVVGGSPAVRESVRRAIDEAGLAARVEHDANDMPALMAWADVGLTAAGSTVWEAAFMGLPSLLVVRASNQHPIAQALGRAGVAALAGTAEAASPSVLAGSLTALARDPERRGEMARRGRELVDGDGAARVVMVMRGDALRLRPAREGDRRLLWEWANDPDVRAVSFGQDPIPWDSHVGWFEARLRDPSCIFYVGVDENDVPVGQIRFDREEDGVVVSVSVGRERRGRGHGRLLIELASQKVHAATGSAIRAYVRPGNQASARTFQRAGYRQAGGARIRGQDALVFVFSRQTPATRSG
ncbi:MAG: UDP-2,4-diacetamido-2,4,6-trideoxy-beta-L-altropyranose hydrolase [Candidatus Methylomirabilaceae bacterium]